MYKVAYHYFTFMENAKMSIKISTLNYVLLINWSPLIELYSLKRHHTQISLSSLEGWWHDDWHWVSSYLVLEKISHGYDISDEHEVYTL